MGGSEKKSLKKKSRLQHRTTCIYIHNTNRRRAANKRCTFVQAGFPPSSSSSSSRPQKLHGTAQHQTTGGRKIKNEATKRLLADDPHTHIRNLQVKSFSHDEPFFLANTERERGASICIYIFAETLFLFGGERKTHAAAAVKAGSSLGRFIAIKKFHERPR